MTQYLMRKENDFENLGKAIKSYEPLFFHASLKFSRSHKKDKIRINENLEGKDFSFYFDNGVVFSSDRKILYLPLTEYHEGFRLEYCDNYHRRIYPYDFYPDDPKMPEVERSVFRNVIDDLLIEISFKGKIKLEYDDTQKNFKSLVTNFWKIA